MTTYSDKLKDPRWQLYRIIAIHFYGGKCNLCGCTHHLQVHHIEYLENLEPADIVTDELMEAVIIIG